MSTQTRLTLQIIALGIAVLLLGVSVAAYMTGGSGRLPSAIALGAAGWAVFAASLKVRKP